MRDLIDRDHPLAHAETVPSGGQAGGIALDRVALLAVAASLHEWCCGLLAVGMLVIER
jgi:hypothetical protein